VPGYFPIALTLRTLLLQEIVELNLIEPRICIHKNNFATWVKTIRQNTRTRNIQINIGARRNLIEMLSAQPVALFQQQVEVPTRTKLGTVAREERVNETGRV
jgi:hypothetical protein